MEGLSPLSNESLRDRIVDAIRDAIVRGDFRPGQKIPEGELATQLGVSRTPIREAVQLLEYQGLVETRPKRGTYIATLESDDLQAALAVRSTLEQMAVRTAIIRAGDRWLEFCEQLSMVLEDMREAVAAKDAPAATQADISWHGALVDAAGNRFLSQAWRTVGSPMLVWTPEIEMYPLAPGEWDSVLRKHEDLLDVLRLGDAERASVALDSHILGKLTDLDEWHRAAHPKIDSAEGEGTSDV